MEQVNTFMKTVNWLISFCMFRKILVSGQMYTFSEESGRMFCDDSTMSCDDYDKNKHDILRLTLFKQGKICGRKYSAKGYSFGVS